MPNAPRVSIVIPAFVSSPHHLALLEETLRTVDAQTFADFETVVVDDGSPVNVASALTKRAHLTVVRQPNAGPAMARNRGIKETRGEHIVFLDADDHLLPGALEAGLRAFEAHPECGFVIGRREEMTYEGGPVPWGVAASPKESNLYETLLAFDWYIIPPSSAMFRRSVVEAVGGFRDPWGPDDLDFYLRVARAYPAYCHEEPVTRYRRYSASTSRDGERMLRGIRTVYERQLPHVAGNASLERAYERGLGQLVAIFRDCLVENIQDRVRARAWRRAARSTVVLAREDPRRLFREAAAVVAPRSWRPAERASGE